MDEDEDEGPWSFHCDLGGVSEVAERLDVSVFRVRRWIERRDSTKCPLPVRMLRNGAIFDLRAWEGWFALWRLTRGSETWSRGARYEARRDSR